MSKQNKASSLAVLERYAATVPSDSFEGKSLHAGLKGAFGFGLGRMKDGEKDDYNRLVRDSGEWQVIFSTSPDPLNLSPRGKELARKEFRFADPNYKSLVMSSADDWIKANLRRFRR